MVGALLLECHTITNRFGAMKIFKRWRGDVALLLLGATLASYVLLGLAVAVYAVWTVLHPITEAVAK